MGLQGHIRNKAIAANNSYKNSEEIATSVNLECVSYVVIANAFKKFSDASANAEYYLNITTHANLAGFCQPNNTFAPKNLSSQHKESLQFRQLGIMGTRDIEHTRLLGFSPKHGLGIPLIRIDQMGVGPLTEDGGVKMLDKIKAAIPDITEVSSSFGLNSKIARDESGGGGWLAKAFKQLGSWLYQNR